MLGAFRILHVSYLLKYYFDVGNRTFNVCFTWNLRLMIINHGNHNYFVIDHFCNSQKLWELHELTYGTVDNSMYICPQLIFYTTGKSSENRDNTICNVAVVITKFFPIKTANWIGKVCDLRMWDRALDSKTIMLPPDYNSSMG